jgi:glycosyltransferase involved in cell wall biosynthesis
MRCPRLNELPAAQVGKTGWPWTEESRRLQDQMPDGRAWPRISVVTPSYNQGQFIEETIRSVLLQGYPNLEYFVFDGGSSDNSKEVIQRYSPWLTHWVSQSDGGQSAAINRGLNMSSGLYATWINSDDLLHKDALVEHASRIGFAENAVYVGICLHTDVTGRSATPHEGRIHSLEDLLSISTVWRSKGNIVQPEVLFPLDLALGVGGLDPANHFTMDYELWGKFFLAGAKFQYTGIPFAIARMHPEQKTQDGLRQTRALIATAAKLISLAENFSEETRNHLMANLDVYWSSYQKEYWRSSGRLARIGLPAIVVKPLRKLRVRLLQKLHKSRNEVSTDH